MPGEMVERVVEMPTPDGVMRGKIAVTAGPMRLTGLVRTAFALTNALVSRAVAQEAEAGRPLSCKAGCGACCRHMVPVSPPEAFHLAEVIERLDADRRRTVERRFDAVTATLERHGMIEELLAPPPTDQPVLPVARRYFELGMACPFLEDESCGIHADRPVVCRDYNVTSPPAWCGRPYEHDIAKIPLPLPLSVPLARTAARVAGERACLIPLTLAPRWAAGNAELGGRTWPGPALFDLLLEEMRAVYADDANGAGPRGDPGLALPILPGAFEPARRPAGGGCI